MAIGMRGRWAFNKGGGACKKGASSCQNEGPRSKSPFNPHRPSHDGHPCDGPQAAHLLPSASVCVCVCARVCVCALECV